jgi:HPt (histidine-containing phosphotransfer) domain-containing protein
MDEQAVIDPATYDEFRSLMGLDFARELTDTYIAETEELVAQLQQALASSDTATFVRSAHSIKSASASLGALSLSQLARELEMGGKANAFEEVRAKVEQLVAHFAAVKCRLEELRDEP